MTSRWYSTVVDAEDPPRLARWWCAVLAWEVLADDVDETVIGGPGEPRLVFVPVPETKAVKNRLHLDLVPDDQAAEVARLEGMGARRVEIGQSARRDPPAFWIVMVDPEGNEFCVLKPR